LSIESSGELEKQAIIYFIELVLVNPSEFRSD
jgi:hypothetical protein